MLAIDFVSVTTREKGMQVARMNFLAVAVHESSCLCHDSSECTASYPGLFAFYRHRSVSRYDE